MKKRPLKDFRGVWEKEFGEYVFFEGMMVRFLFEETRFFLKR